MMKTALLATLIVVLATPAFAHAHLKAASPADGDALAASPVSLRLAFSEGLELSFSGIDVAGPSGAVALGPPKLEGDTPATLVVPVATPLAPGKYTVSWHALSSDGHKTTGTYSFTVK